MGNQPNPAVPSTPYTRQQMLDIVVPALRKQGRQSLDGCGMCMYRGEGGAKCAVGHLIPDELYDRKMERHTIADLVFAGTCRLGEVPTMDKVLSLLDAAANTEFLRELQAAHDGSSWVGGFPEAGFRDVATQYGLVYPEAAAVAE